MAASSPSPVQPFEVWWPALVDATHAIVSGGKGSGKTTLVRAVMLDLACQGAQFVMIDPHHKKDEWGPGITPIAAGRRFEAARMAFAWGNQELDRRYKLRADQGTEDFPLVVFVVDEFDLFTDKRPDVSDDLRELASRFLSMIGDESRKVGMRLIVIAHGTEVKNLGLEGRGNKRLNYTIVQLQQGPNQQPEPTGVLRIGSTVWTIDTTPVLDRAAGQLDPAMLVQLPEVQHADDLSTDPIALQQRIRTLEQQLTTATTPAAPAGVLELLDAALDELAALQRDLRTVLEALRSGRAAQPAARPSAPQRTAKAAPAAPRRRTSAKRQPAKKRSSPKPVTPKRVARSTDPIYQALAIPSIAAKIGLAQRTTEPRAAAYIPRVLRVCWNTALSPHEIAEGQGTLSATTIRRIQTACVALQKVELLEGVPTGGDRFRVNQATIERLRGLAQTVKQR